MNGGIQNQFRHFGIIHFDRGFLIHMGLCQGMRLKEEPAIDKGNHIDEGLFDGITEQFFDFQNRYTGFHIIILYFPKALYTQLKYHSYPEMRNSSTFYTIADISEGMTCPIDAIRTFLKLARVPTISERDSLAVNAYPFTISFGPSTVVPTFNKNMITDTQSDTLLYRGNRYQLINIQICQPTHTKYTDPNKSLIAEIALTYTNTTVATTYPSVILAILPIYEGGLPDHNAFLQQFIDGAGKAVSAQSLFYENDGDKTATSYSYKCCFQVRNNENTTQTLVFNTGVHYFPRGTTLLPTSIQTFRNLIATQNPNQANYGIMPFEFLPFQRGNYSTYLAANQWDRNGAIPTLQVSPTEDIFTKRVQYMTQPPLKTSEGDVCPYKKVSDYKCYPFSELNNITKDGSGNEVVVPLADAMNPQKNDKSQNFIDWSSTVMYVVPFIVFIGLVILAGFALLITNQISNRGLPPSVSTSDVASKMNAAVVNAKKG